MTIKTLVLRVIVNYHGHLGIHLHSLNHHRLNLFRLLWNVTLNSSLYYCMYFFDPYTAKGYTVDPRKPLHLILYFDVFILFPVAYLLCLLYYHFTGRRIVTELNDDLLTNALFQRGNKHIIYSVAIIFFVFSLIHLNFYLTHGFVIQQHFEDIAESRSLLSSLLSLVTIFVIYNNWYFVLFLVHYYKTATYLALKGISRQLLHKECSADESNSTIFLQAVEGIRHLAATNRRLNSILSMPLFTFLLIFTVDGVASISLSEFIRTFESYLHIVVMLLYIAYLAYLSMKTQSELQAIASCCQNALEKEEKLEDEMKERERKSLQIYLQEVALYFDSFQLNVFHMCAVNFEFLSTTILVSFGYCVFIIQTSR